MNILKEKAFLLKICSKCGYVGSNTDFKKDGGTLCKKCETKRTAQWVKDNQQKAKETKARIYISNKDEILSKSKMWAEDHPGEVAKRCAEWYKKLRSDPIAWEEYKKNRNEYRRAHPEQRTSSNHKRRALARELIVYSNQEWNDLKVLYSNCCLCCGKQEPEVKLTADHVVPLSDGGVGTIDNIQPLCKPCNSSKGIKRTDYRHR